MNGRRLILYLLLNALVSAAVTLTVLWLWDRAQPAAPAAGLTATATPPVIEVAASTQPPELVQPTSAELPTPTLYVVQSGDSLGSIAQAYDLFSNRRDGVLKVSIQP